MLEELLLDRVVCRGVTGTEIRLADKTSGPCGQRQLLQRPSSSPLPLPSSSSLPASSSAFPVSRARISATSSPTHVTKVGAESTLLVNLGPFNPLLACKSDPEKEKEKRCNYCWS